MQHTNEHLPHLDASPLAQAHEVSLEMRATHVHMDEMFALRETMLSSLKSDIGTSLYEALQEKIRYERASLLERMQRDARAAHSQKKQDSMLKTEYFTKKSLDTDMFYI